MEKKYYTMVDARADGRIKRYVPAGKTGQILRYMQAGRKISSMTAFMNFNETRLSAVIFNLKKYGYEVKDEWAVSPNGERYKVYYMEVK